ncbi:MAG: hypothetical protein GXP59_07410 [Deltaproteobacteria bacterium]|nr:hypothetical protein [Deltaproteobacteria bacterium]
MKTMARILILSCVILSLAIVAVSPAAAARKKILYVDSYNPQYMWTADITAGIKAVLAARRDVELKIFHMDTKRHKSEKFKKAAAVRAKKLIDSWRPDVVIASDDNAAKYLIAPYYKGSKLPVVFCGLNWDASVYGFPTKNITGMVEVALYRPTVKALKKFTRGSRIGYLASDTVSERKEYNNIVKRFHAHFQSRFVKTFVELKQAFLDLQKSSDLIIIQECRSVKGFDDNEMIRFVNENTRVPTGAMQKYLAHYVLLTFAKVGEEQGRYAARTALAILGGKSPAAIPLTANHQARLYVNMGIARTLGLKIPRELLVNAHLISAVRKKLFYVNSYNKGYKWSDDIEKGLLKALHIRARPDGTFDTSKSEVAFRLFRMNTKINRSETLKKRAALTARAIIEEWQPDIVVTSDDNAAKYLVAPYYKNASLPFVFCGINWDASMYGFPTKNITGMVEVAPVHASIALARRFAKGGRLGFIGADTMTERKNMANFRKRLGLRFTDGALVSTFAGWRKVYLRLQHSVDMLVMLSPAGIRGWHMAWVEKFILANSRIPSVGTGDHLMAYSLLGRVRIAEEQGWWAGKTALRILHGARPVDIPITTNKQSRLYLNMKLAGRLGIKFPMQLINEATFVQDMGEDK